MAATSSTFDALVSATSAHIDRRGEAHIDCPYCGKEAKRGQTHASFSPKGFKCFVCGQSAGLERLAAQLAIPVEHAPRHDRTAPEPPKPRIWQSDPERYLDGFCAAWGRLEAWQSYKPLTIETIARWRLGVGVLPSSPCQHRRLIYPVIEGGQIVGFRGRREKPCRCADECICPCQCDKWISAGGTTARLWGVDLLRPGASVIIAENPVDAMLAMQQDSSIVAVAGTAGASTWRDEWSQAIASSRPAVVLVWYDNDLAGSPNQETYRAELGVWLRTMQQRMEAGKIREIPPAPRPSGPKVVQSLISAGVRASAYEWPAGTAAKADLGGLLADEIRRAA